MDNTNKTAARMTVYTSKEESGMTKTAPKSWTGAKLVKTTTPSYCAGYQRAEQAAMVRS